MTKQPPLTSASDPEAAAVEAVVASAIEWRQRINLVPATSFTQEMFDKLDTPVILRSRK